MSEIGQRFKLFESAIEVVKMTGTEPPSTERVLEDAVKAEYCRVMDLCIQRAIRPGNEPQKPYEYLAINDWRFAAQIAGLKDRNSIRISQGLLWALNDIFIRLSANVRFFSYDDGDWLFGDGCECAWTYPGGKIAPKIRFVDYTPVTMSANGSILSRHIEVYPYHQGRRALAELMMEIAVTFIIIHEQTHYEAGHLDYLQDKYSAESRGEGGIYNTELDDLESRIMEWEADFQAARGVAHIYCSPSRIHLLPEMYKDKEKWMIRAVLTAVGTAFILMQKARIYYGAGASHPHPRSRFINSCLHIESCLRRDRPAFHEKFLSQAMASLVELGTVSNLAVQDGPLAECIPGTFPKRHQTSALDFLDTDANEKQVMEYLFYVLSNNRTVNAPSENHSHREMFDKWFAENLELQEHQHAFFDKMAPYRNPIGMIS